MVSDDSVFLLYALFFRFGIIAAGIYIMSLGYRLLLDDKRYEGPNTNVKAAAEVAVPGGRIKIKNVTSGSIFSLFGALLIVAMVLQGNPEKTSQRLITRGDVSETEHLRGGGTDSISADIQSGLDAERRGAIDEAETFFNKALAKTAPALNGIAWIYARGNTPEKGLAFAEAAVQVDASNAHYLDTLGEAQFNAGDKSSALKTIEHAAKLDPTFKSRLEEFRRRATK